MPMPTFPGPWNEGVTNELALRWPLHSLVPSVFCGLTGQAEAGAVLVETPWAPLSLLLHILERVLSSGPVGPVRIKGDKHGGVERAQAACVPEGPGTVWAGL